MRFKAFVDDAVHDVEIEPVEGGYDVTVDGKAHRVDTARLESSFYSLITDGRSFEVSVRDADDRDVVVVGHGSIVQEVRMVDPLFAAAGAALGAGPAEVRAVMPGRIVQVHVREGEAVEAGQSLLVLEAMKMENEVTAPRSGEVRSISVTEGETVESGTKLAIIE